MMLSRHDQDMTLEDGADIEERDHVWLVEHDLGRRTSGDDRTVQTRFHDAATFKLLEIRPDAVSGKVQLTRPCEPNTRSWAAAICWPALSSGTMSSLGKSSQVSTCWMGQTNT